MTGSEPTRKTELKRVTIGVVIAALLAIVLLSLIRVQTAHDGDSHDGPPHHHESALFMRTGAAK